MTSKLSFTRLNLNLLPLGLVVLLHASIAIAQVPSLVIDSGGSTRFVRSLVFIENGKKVVSVGGDKVVRIWDVKTGKTTRTIRTPASGCGECVIAALAVSKDEKYLALGGVWSGTQDTKYAVYVYNFDTGQLLQPLKNHVSAVISLAFSPDGSQLASGGEGSNEKGLLDINPVRIWKLRWDRWQFDRRLTSHKEAITSLSFSPDGKRLVSASHDTYVGFWNLEDSVSNNAPLQKSHSDQVTSVTFSPDGQYVASGGLDGRVKLWNSSGTFIKDLMTQTEGVVNVLFSPRKDPLSLAVGLENGGCSVLSVPTGTVVSTARRPADKFDDKVRALAFSPDGEKVASSGGFNGEISLWDADDGEADDSDTLAGQGETVWSVGFAKDGNSIAFGTKHTSSQPNKYGPLEKVVRLRKPPKSSSSEDTGPSRYRISLEGEVEKPEDYLTARSESGGYNLTTRFGQMETRAKGSETVKVPVREFRDLLVAKAGETQPRPPMTRSYEEGRTFRSFTLTSDGQHFISGGERGYLAMYETEPGPVNRLKLAHRFFGHTNDVWAVALSEDDQFLVSGSSDQTIKLWDVKSGFNILTIFVGKDREWVAWNTAGYYTSSVGGDKYFGWQINRGPEQLPEFYSAAQFAKEYYRPDVIAESFRAPDVKLAVTQADKWRHGTQIAALTAQVVDVSSILPPMVTISKPEKDQLVVQDRMFRLKLYAVSNTLPIIELRVSLNGAPKGTFKGDARRPDESKRLEVEMVVALAEGENKLFVVAENAGAVSKPQIRTIYYKPSNVPEFDESAQPRQRNPRLQPRIVSHHPVREAVSIKPVPTVAAQPTPTPSSNDEANARVVIVVARPNKDLKTVQDENLTITATAIARAKNQVELKVFLNDNPEFQHRLDSPTSSKVTLEDVQVTLRPGENVLRFVATDGQATATEEIRLTYTPRTTSTPNLIFLGIGISTYELFRPNLSYAHKDAKAVGDLLLEQKGRLFEDVKVNLIPNEKANRDEIIKGLNWVKSEAKFDNDVRVVLISGHGGIFEDKYFFYSHEHNPADDPETDSIRWSLFWDKLTRPNSNAFLFVDTCRAGKASKDFMRNPDETGIFFFAASRAEETSLEDPRFEHGIFTQALLEGLRGERTLPGNRNADTNNDNQIDSKELQNFIEERVKALNSRQTPVIKPPSVPKPIRLSTYPVPGP